MKIPYKIIYFFLLFGGMGYLSAMEYKSNNIPRLAKLCIPKLTPAQLIMQLKSWKSNFKDDQIDTLDAEKLLIEKFLQPDEIKKCINDPLYIDSLQLTPEVEQKITKKLIEDSCLLFKAANSNAKSFHLSPDKNSAAFVYNNSIKLWDFANTYIDIYHNDSDKDQKITSMTFSPDSTMIAFMVDSNTVHLICAKTGKRIGEFYGHIADINPIYFSHDSKILALKLSNNKNETIQLWDINTKAPIKTSTFPTLNLECFFSPNGETIAFNYDDAFFHSTIYLYDIKTGSLIDSIYCKHGCIISISFSLSQALLLYALEFKYTDLNEIENNAHLTTLFQSLPMEIQNCYPSTAKSTHSSTAKLYSKLKQFMPSIKTVALGVGLAAAAYGIYKYGIPGINYESTHIA